MRINIAFRTKVPFPLPQYSFALQYYNLILSALPVFNQVYPPLGFSRLYIELHATGIQVILEVRKSLLDKWQQFTFKAFTFMDVLSLMNYLLTQFVHTNHNCRVFPSTRLSCTPSLFCLPFDTIT